MRRSPNQMKTKNMARKNDENWITNYEALKTYIEEHHHLPDKHKVENRGLLNFSKYTRKKIKEETLDEEKARELESVLNMRDLTIHTGGRRKNNN